MPTQPKMLVAIPTLLGQVHMDTTQSLVESMIDLHKHGVTVALNTVMSSDLAGNRNRLANQAVHSPADYLLFVDSDMGWPPTAVRELMAHKVDLVAGVGQSRHGNHVLCCLNPRPSDRPGLDEVDSVGCAFMLVSRRLLERMTRVWGAHGLFKFDHERKLSEDVHFCAKARGLGFTVYVDPTLKLRHHGDAVYEMTLAEAQQLGLAGTIKKSIPPILPSELTAESSN